MRLWDWALAAYARPGARDACLALQDEHGQNVPLLLAAAWAADEKRDFDLTAAVALTLDWETGVVGPLRAVRRTLKRAQAGIGDRGREALRDKVKAVELDAERVLLSSLEALAQPPGDAAASLTDAAGAWAHAAQRNPPPDGAVNDLARLICYDGGR